MGNGLVRKGIVVYSFEEVKEIHPSSGRKGMWAFQAKHHEGHIRCAEACQHCDWVVGVLYNNMEEGEKLMFGYSTTKTFPIEERDIDVLKKYSDVCLILTGDYHPYKNYWNLIEEEWDKYFPDEFLMKNNISTDMNILLYSVAIRVLIHKVYNLDFDYQAQCGKDRFRTIGYTDYVFNNYGVYIDLIDSAKDKYGNSISKTKEILPEELKRRINKQLLLSEFVSIDQVREHINTIQGLKVVNFYRTDKWIHSTFKFDGHKEWMEGIKCK